MSHFRSHSIGIRKKLHQGQYPFGPPKIEIVGSKNLQVSQLIPHTQLVVSPKFVPVAGPADALKIFAAVGILSV
jgi:hypothetical protein